MHTRTKKTLAGLAVALVVGACSGTDTVDEAVDDATATVVSQAEDATGTTLSADNADAVAKLQTSMDLVSTEIEEADLGPELAVAWTEIQARVTDALDGADFDSSELSALMDTLESQVTLDDNPEFESAWSEFRAEFETFASSSS